MHWKKDLELSGNDIKSYIVYNDLKNKENASVVMGLDNMVLKGK